MERIPAAALLFALLGCVSGSASASVLSFATAQDGSVVAILTTGPCPEGVIPSTDTPSVTTSGNQISVASGGAMSSGPFMVMICNPIAAPGISLQAPLGKLADGTYTVSWTYGPGISVGSFAIIGGALSSIYPTSIGGFWYDPNATGSGFNLEMQAFGLLVTYYGWDAAGNRLWLTSDFGPTSLIPGTAVTLNMQYTSGGTFVNPVNNVVPWGTLVLNFASCRQATAALSGKDGTVNLSLVHLTYINAVPGC